MAKSPNLTAFALRLKVPLLPMVGRTGFEPVTNGLKGRYALIARGAFPLCNVRRRRAKSSFPPTLCQILPTIGTGEYQPLRPVRQPSNHGRKAVNPYSNIGQIRAALPSGLSGVVPTIRLDFSVTKKMAESLGTA